MITRHYFILVESKPQLAQIRKNAGKQTVASAIITHKSFLPNPNQAMVDSLSLLESQGDDFNLDDIIVTSFVKI